MIVIDTSAIIAVLLEEPTARHCIDAIVAASPDVTISSGTWVEIEIVSSGKGIHGSAMALLRRIGPLVEAVTADFAREAGSHYRIWGRGFHAASLNMGDIYAYTLARRLSAPLLFVGNDFAKTDILSALAP